MTEQVLARASPASQWVPRQRTALHRAAMVGDSQTMSALIQGGCALDLQDRDGNTALHEASWHGFSPCVKLLVKARADLNIKNKAGNIALHLSSQNAHVPCTRLLLLGGSNIDTKNNAGETCLHVAARYDNRAVIEVLISSQCSLTEENERGDTALHIAAALNHKKTVQLLLQAGIDANLRNKAGRTALDKARDSNHKELAVILARAPQVHNFLRRRTLKNQKEKQRSQSACRVEAESNPVDVVDQGSSSATEEVPISYEEVEKSKTHFKKVTSPVSQDNHKTQKQEEKDKIGVEKTLKKQKQHLFDCDDVYLKFGKSYQLYTLYRDKDGNVRQSPASTCHCKPQFKKLENELKSTQEQMKFQILSIQDEVNRQIGQMEHHNKEQMKMMDMINQARVAAERRHMMYRLEQQAAQGREDARMTQAAVRGELKKWCVSQLKHKDVFPASTSAPYSKLVHSPSAGHSYGGSDPESLPLLPVISTDSSSSLATYVNIAPSWSSYSLGSEQDASGRKYFEMKVDRSPDDYENTALFPLSGSYGRLSSAALSRQPEEVQRTEPSVKGEGFGSSSSLSSDCAPRWVTPKGKTPDTRGMQELVKVGPNQDTAIEIYKDRPHDDTFSLERTNLHAMEVTQRFFETVSTQLELWYERKIAEMERQTEAQAQKDKQELLQRFSTLEAELQNLRTNENTDSTEHENTAESQD